MKSYNMNDAFDFLDKQIENGAYINEKIANRKLKENLYFTSREAKFYYSRWYHARKQTNNNDQRATG